MVHGVYYSAAIVFEGSVRPFSWQDYFLSLGVIVIVISAHKLDCIDRQMRKRSVFTWGVFRNNFYTR